MYPGVWIGKKFKETEKKMLVLGESHYDKYDVGKVTFTTRSIIMKYLDGHYYKFFTGIANTFGYVSKDEICDFYEHICFGNYVNVIVDKDNKEQDGKSFIKKFKQVYNKELFDFCINNSIDIVACFSMESYWNLPSDGEGKGTETIPRENGKSIKTRKWLYKKGTLGNDSMILDKDLLVYGICHPSWPGGYNANLEYEEYVSKQLELAWVCKASTI